MTTIAYRDDVLAGDTQITCGNTIDGYVQKVFRKGALLYGATGCSGHADAFLTWVLKGMKGDAPNLKTDDDEASGLLFPGGDRVVWRYRNVWTSHHAPFFAYGSGSNLALGAMAQGATAEEAVKAAAMLDTNTGGDITVLRRQA